MASKNSQKDQEMAKHLLSRGIFHGKRLSRPAANSGGTAMGTGPGSSKNMRRLASR